MPAPDAPLLAIAASRAFAEAALAAVAFFARFLFGARTPAAVFGATWQMEEAPYLGDTWVFRRIDALAQGEHPLLVRTEGRLGLTAEGHRALAG